MAAALVDQDEEEEYDDGLTGAAVVSEVEKELELELDHEEDSYPVGVAVVSAQEEDWAA